MDYEPKGYVKLYLYTLIEMLIAIMLVLFSQALDINAEKYYPSTADVRISYNIGPNETQYCASSIFG